MQVGVEWGEIGWGTNENLWTGEGVSQVLGNKKGSKWTKCHILALSFGMSHIDIGIDIDKDRVLGKYKKTGVVDLLHLPHSFKLKDVAKLISRDLYNYPPVTFYPTWLQPYPFCTIQPYYGDNNYQEEEGGGFRPDGGYLKPEEDVTPRQASGPLGRTKLVLYIR